MDIRSAVLVPRTGVKVLGAAALALVSAAVLLLTASYNYLLFHSLSEIFSIAVASAVFMFSWNSRNTVYTRPFVLLGIGYLFVALLDVAHTFAYRGMNILPTGQDYATKLWIAARGLQAVVSLVFVILARLRRQAPHGAVFAVIGTVTVVLLASIFWWNIFPVCLVEGQGVTLFKKGSEYAISAVLAVAILLLAFDRDAIVPRERFLLVAAFSVTIASEMVFTLYVSSYGYQNLIGHLLKIVSFCLVYQALFASEVRRRIALINELERSKARLEKSETELLRANLSKDRFFSILAHDLRNPICGILTIAEVLTKRFDELDITRVRELLKFVYDGAREGAELLECILQWARAQTGRLDVQPSCVNLSKLCAGVADLHDSAAKSKGIHILSRVEPAEVAFVDPNMLATVLRNLLSNAVKFTPPGGEVVLTATPQGEWEKISVADTGVGISPEDVGRLFRIDVQFSCPGTNAEKGNGMGLILCKELVELNAGKISVETELGKGTIFSVCLPRMPLAPAASLDRGRVHHNHLPA
jgi:signal transduction histidine kinase